MLPQPRPQGIVRQRVHSNPPVRQQLPPLVGQSGHHRQPKQGEHQRLFPAVPQPVPRGVEEGAEQKQPDVHLDIPAVGSRPVGAEHLRRRPQPPALPQPEIAEGHARRPGQHIGQQHRQQLAVIPLGPLAVDAGIPRQKHEQGHAAHAQHPHHTGQKHGFARRGGVIEAVVQEKVDAQGEHARRRPDHIQPEDPLTFDPLHFSAPETGPAAP